MRRRVQLTPTTHTYVDVPTSEIDWERRPDVEEAHRIGVDRAIERIREEPPLAGTGRGIVTCGGGATYFTAAWVLVYVLRKLGCTLPVEWWHLGPEEMDHRMIQLAESLGNVVTIDAKAVAGRLPERPRMLGGWESKIFALLHSRFAECLFLDADQIPVMDPAFLFDDSNYRACGAVLWPDLENTFGFDVTEQAFRTMRLPIPGQQRIPGHHSPTDYRPVESGQVLVDRRRCSCELRLAWHLANHSDYWFRWSTQQNGKNLIYGDKSCFFLAWWRLAQDIGNIDYGQPRNFAMPPRTSFLGSNSGGGFLQRDFAGRVLFQHRCQPPSKYSLHGKNHDCGFANWTLCLEALATLRRQWIGEPWTWQDQSMQDSRVAANVCGHWWLFQGHNDAPRRIALHQGGRVDGFDGHWTVRHAGELPLIVLCNAKRATAFLYADDHANWIDRDCGISLTPAPAPSFTIRPTRFEALAWASIARENEYRLPPAFRATDVILDIGAHIGIFTRLCLDRGAGLVFAVEPNAENFALLARNVAGDSRCRLFHAAAWECDGEQRLGLGREMHTGGWSLFAAESSHVVKAIAFDSLVKAAAAEAPSGRVRLVKLDCEGSEWAIFLAATTLDLVDEIVGETHRDAAPDGCSIEWLHQRLELAGFEVETVDHGPTGHFWAKRPAPHPTLRAFLVVGPEASGNRCIVNMLASAGCAGKGDHHQPFDAPDGGVFVASPKPTPIALLRSFPHAGTWPDLPRLLEQLRALGYATTVLVMVRDPLCNELAQLRAAHVGSVEEARSNAAAAMRLIFAGLNDTPFLVVPYASLGRERFRRWLESQLDLPGLITAPWLDADAKYQL